MEHPRHLQVCTQVCIIFAHTGAGVIRVWPIISELKFFYFWLRYCRDICMCKKSRRCHLTSGIKTLQWHWHSGHRSSTVIFQQIQFLRKIEIIDTWRSFHLFVTLGAFIDTFNDTYPLHWRFDRNVHCTLYTVQSSTVQYSIFYKKSEVEKKDFFIFTICTIFSWEKKDVFIFTICTICS